MDLKKVEPGYISRYNNGLLLVLQEFESREEEQFSLLLSVQIGSLTHPASYPKGNLSQRVNLLGREGDRSPPFSTEVKNSGANLYSLIYLYRILIN
jgi:hypothetical protein